MGARGFSPSHMLKSLILRTLMTTSDCYAVSAAASSCLSVSFEVGSSLSHASYTELHIRNASAAASLGICIIVMLSKSS